MQLYHFMICIIWTQVFSEIFAEWEALLPFKTQRGRSCITPCEKRGYSYYWCETYGTNKPHDKNSGTWEDCSASPNVTVNGELCNGPCQRYLNHYFYCYTNSNKTNWDYCGDTSLSPSTTVVPQLKTANGGYCASPCIQTSKNYFWCFKAGGGAWNWDWCSTKPHFDATISTQLISTYVGSKCLTPCQPFGSGANYCYDARTKARLCSRVQGLTVNNEVCQTECDLQGGNSSAPVQTYLWCWTNDARSTWDYCSHVNDNSTVLYGLDNFFPKERIPLRWTQLNSLENIYSHEDERGSGHVTFFEQMARTGNESFYKIHNNTQLQKWALECLENWRWNYFKLSNSDNTPMATSGAIILDQQSTYKFEGLEYTEMQLQVSICKDRMHTMAEVHAAVDLVKKFPEHVFGAFLRSMNYRYAVHVGRFEYKTPNPF